MKLAKGITQVLQKVNNAADAASGLVSRGEFCYLAPR